VAKPRALRARRVADCAGVSSRLKALLRLGESGAMKYWLTPQVEAPLDPMMKHVPKAIA